ncbi:MAG: glycosylase [Eubacterium sp.]|nr:glycosylase [Eubacterium sp.]
MSKWLDDALFYEIYPQSFCDSNGDGIGDINGIISKLDYIQSLGCNAIWMNPCYDSPFIDAGYDVRDYFKVAPRYGTNDDAERLCSEVHRRGMHILLDLVPGHTSDQCRWFRESQRDEKNEYTDRYIWTDTVWENVGNIVNVMGMTRGGTERNGAYLTNFFNAQPALNYGFANPDPERPWQQPPDAEGPRSTVEAMKDVMRFWLSLGCDGFRVDMAGSLIKADPDQSANIRVWQEFRDFLDKEFPDAVMVSEWGEPDKSLLAGFHMDFLLHFGPSHYMDLFRTETPYFSREGKGDLTKFFDLYRENMENTRYRHPEADVLPEIPDGGMMCIPSGNHDMVRIARFLDPEEMKIAYAFIMTMPGVPFIYYGDEIGMKYVEGLTSVEGGYERTGSRSPMAFDDTKNAGFSAAPEEMLYIKQDASKAYINVMTEENDPDSLLNEVRRLTKIRREHPALHNRSDFRLLAIGNSTVKNGQAVTDSVSSSNTISTASHYPLAYIRSCSSETILAIFNPSSHDAPLPFELPDGYEVICTVGKIRNNDIFKNDPADNKKDALRIFPAESAILLLLDPDTDLK